MTQTEAKELRKQATQKCERWTLLYGSVYCDAKLRLKNAMER